jgi:hypothetical protein
MMFNPTHKPRDAHGSLDRGLIFAELGLFKQITVSCPTPIKLLVWTDSTTKPYFRKIGAEKSLCFSVVSDQVKLTIPKQTPLLSPKIEIYALRKGWFFRGPRGLIQVEQASYPKSLYLSVEDEYLQVLNGVTMTDFLYASLMKQLLLYPLSWQVKFLQSAPAALESLKVIAIICRSALWEKNPPLTVAPTPSHQSSWRLLKQQAHRSYLLHLSR